MRKRKRKTNEMMSSLGDSSFFQQQAKDEIEKSINELSKEHYEKSN